MSHTNTPLYSIITVAYNAAGEIEHTLKSVAEQSYTNYEYIVVDGASTDNTLAIVEQYKGVVSTLISEPDIGIYNAMNKGLERATGDYVIFLNAGDTLYNNETLAQASQQIGESRPDVIYGDTALVDSQRNYLGMRRLKTPEQLSWRSFKQGMLVCHQAFWAKRTLAPSYNEAYRLSSDFDWCIRVLKASHNCYNLHQTTINYLSEGMTTQHHKASLKERYRIMCNYYGTLPTLVRHVWFAMRSLFATLTKR